MKIGTLYIVSASSGTGKTSLIHQLLKKVSNVKCSISYTTRKPRDTEKNGVNYFFVSEETFKNLITRGEFLEYAHVFGHSYGTSRAFVARDLKAGFDVILEIDWQGARQVREQMPEAKSIFILPPSKKALQQRIVTRDQDQPMMIKRRLNAAAEEISHYTEYDYLIVNDNFDEALTALCSIIEAHRYQCDKQRIKLSKLLKELLQTS